MFQICIMGGHEGVVRPEKRIYLTLMGACELKRATVARQILAARQQQQQGMTKPRWQFFLTIMGAAEIKCPTLAEEFIDLREMISSRALTMDDWDRAMADLTRSDVTISAFTLMGGFAENVLPSDDEEIESLAVQRHLGNISENEGEVLQYGIGRRDVERRATLRRAVTAEV